jgi:peptidoglycan biosynthesis protein MviN/MurJ (putative lipid II flippase)
VALGTLDVLSFRGLALADAAKQVSHAVILYVLLRRWQGRIEGLEVRGALGKVVGAGLAMALFCYGALRLAGTQWTTGTLHLLAFVVSTGGAGVILYLLLLYWWGVPELTVMVKRVRARLAQ